MIRVSIADGNKDTLEGISSLLSCEPEISVIGQAQNGEALLEQIRQGNVPDVVLTDIHLPRMNGILLAEHFGRHFPFIKTMVFTLEDQEHYMIDAFKSGIKSYINKAITREELVFAVKQVHQGKYYVCTHLASKLTKLFLKGVDVTEMHAEPEINFSPREIEVLQLIADGATNQEIADKLFTSRRTVEGHRQSMINKTGVRNTPALVKYAMRYHLLKVTPLQIDTERHTHQSPKTMNL
jgi:two-component system response regulator NreC